MIEMITMKGEKYSFDPDTERIFKDGYLMSSVQAEPIYSDNSSENIPPRFSGILLKATNTIVSLSGKVNQITDINSVY